MSGREGGMYDKVVVQYIVDIHLIRPEKLLHNKVS